jgi:hypothetical protein
LFYIVTRTMTRKLEMDHPIHTYIVHALVHHDCQKLSKLSAMGERPFMMG